MCAEAIDLAKDKAAIVVFTNTIEMVGLIAKALNRSLGKETEERVLARLDLEHAIEGRARDPQRPADLRDGVALVSVQRLGHRDLLRVVQRGGLRPPTLSAPCSRRGYTGQRPLADDVSLELRECPEHMEDQLAPTGGLPTGRG